MSESAGPRIVSKLLKRGHTPAQLTQDNVIWDDVIEQMARVEARIRSVEPVPDQQLQLRTYRTIGDQIAQFEAVFRLFKSRYYAPIKRVAPVIRQV